MLNDDDFFNSAIENNHDDTSTNMNHVTVPSPIITTPTATNVFDNKTSDNIHDVVDISDLTTDANTNTKKPVNNNEELIENIIRNDDKDAVNNGNLIIDNPPTPTISSTSTGMVEDIINPNLTDFDRINKAKKNEKALMLSRSLISNTFNRFNNINSNTNNMEHHKLDTTNASATNTSTTTSNNNNNNVNNGIGNSINDANLPSSFNDINDYTNFIHSNVETINSSRFNPNQPLYSQEILRNSISDAFKNYKNNSSNNNNNNSNILSVNPNLSANNTLQNSNSNSSTNIMINKNKSSHKTRPAFVNKLWSMINDETNQDYIKWSDDGKSFIIDNRENFVHNILPKYFKHSNFASFVRQLNMYGWHKMQDIKSGSMKNGSDDRWQFENDNFQKGREDLLEKIVRQKGNQNNSHNEFSNNTTTNSNLNNGTKFSLPDLMGHIPLSITNGPENIQLQNNLSTMINEIEQIKFNQIAISKDLLRINKDNELLWKENLMARERYRSQQQILEKIFRFLAAMVPHVDQKTITDGLMNNSTNATTNTTANINDDNNNSSNNNGHRFSSMDSLSRSHTPIRRNNPNFNFNQDINEKSDGGIFDDTMMYQRGQNPGINENSKYSRNNNTNNSISNTTANTNISHAYLESLDDDEISTTTTKNNLMGINRPKPLLLKNRSHSSSVRDIPNIERPIVSSENNNITPIEILNDTHFNKNLVDNNGFDRRISEIPFDENDADEEIVTKNDNHNSNNNSNNNNNNNSNESSIQEIEIDRSNGLHNNKEVDSDKKSNYLIKSLNDSILEQDNRIHHLENIINSISPNTMNWGGNTNNNTESLEQLNSHDINCTDLFNLQDYEDNGGNSITGTTGLTPIPMDENDVSHLKRSLDREGNNTFNKKPRH